MKLGLSLAVIWALLALCGLNLPAGTLPLMPLELPLILLALSLPIGRTRGMRLVILALMMLALLLKLADATMRSTLDRSFNLAVDMPLVGSFLDLLAQSFGTVVLIGATALLLLGLGLVTLVLWRSLAACARAMPRGGRAQVGLAAVLVLLTATGSPQASRFLIAQGDDARQGFDELRRFREAARSDPMREATPDLGLIDRDVLVVFLESYGRTSFDTPYYAKTHLPLLRREEARLAAAGLAMRSGFLASPTHGGQSWLAHATLAAGLRIDDQARYRAALASGRQGLFHMARKAGFRTATVVPGITRPWPEAAEMGFDDVLVAGDLGYRGKPFNWVTMPDQFTLAAADRLLPRPGDPRHLMAQIVLISSHAPWVPVPRLVDWATLGDGRGFDAMAGAGDAPEVVWRSPERVRAQYRMAIAYSVGTALSYARLHAADPPLIILLGDHQAATTIGEDGRREVPIHVIGPRALVDRTAVWGLTPGLVPPTGAEAIPMEALRDLFLRSFSTATDRPA